MVLSLRIAARYLFSKKSHSAINVISIISVCGVAIITAALICTLSVYNGFSHLIGSLLSEIQPDIKILFLRLRNFEKQIRSNKKRKAPCYKAFHIQ